MLPTEPLTDALRRSNLVQKGSRILVALSGGPDSTALLVALVEDGHDVRAAHFDHALRPSSAKDAEFAAALCGRLGVPLVMERRSEPMPHVSVQAAARTLRYAFLARARIATDAEVVALAHIADDVVEGAALNMLRGCGIAGLRGMPARRGVFVRPLLRVWREDVRRFLALRSIVALEDPSNADVSYARVRMRTRLLPALERDRPGIVRRLHRVATRAAQWQLEIEAAAQSLFDGARSALAQADNAVLAEALRHLYVKAGGVEPGLSRAHIMAMRRLLPPGRGGRGVDLPGGFRFRVVGDKVEFIRSSTKRQEAHLNVTACRGCNVPGAIHLKAGLDLKLGYRLPGLRLRPVGGRGTRKLQDLFVDARVPREDRDRWPLVFAGEQLAWVPGLAVDANLAAKRGESALHVSVSIASGGEAENRVLKSIELIGDLN